MIRLYVVLFITIKAALAIELCFDHSEEEQDQEAQIENAEEQDRRITESENSSSLYSQIT